MKIVVLDGYALNPGDLSWSTVASLGDLEVHDRTPPEQVVERAKDADIVLTNKAVVDADAISRLPSLKFIGVLATGYNVVDVAAARARGIAVANVPLYGTESVAQFVIALLLALAHRVEKHSDLVLREGRWVTAPDWTFTAAPQVELAGKVFGIIGFGRIGQRVGELAHAFGMRVLANSTSRSQHAPYPFEWRSIEEVFSEADVVSLHCPLTASNREFVNSALLKRMKPPAFLINTARGLLVKEEDLAMVLRNGIIAGAACDVASMEPVRADNPLLSAPNLILTPHIAWSTKEARTRLMDQAVRNIRAFQNGAPINVVN
ncbi:D-2-hydroxyacid dehydrogenase [Candidatus Sumerlaeota bacterium]|nr:D-2-hydroxyacid dehydrogenase [Candidatus Sumerlaeota bacterium]